MRGHGFRDEPQIHELLDLSDRVREMIWPKSRRRRFAARQGRRHALPARVGAGQSAAGDDHLKEINKVTFIEAMRKE